jgi:translation initiation factor 1 (eIF-1/SUI1)
MSLANEQTVGAIDAPLVYIKVIKRNGRKKITTISGLFSTKTNSELPPYIGEKKDQKLVVSKLGKLCAAGASIIDSRKAVGKKSKIEDDDDSEGQKVIQIQGANIESILDYLHAIGIPADKIKLCGLADD